MQEKQAQKNKHKTNQVRKKMTKPNQFLLNLKWDKVQKKKDKEHFKGN